MKKLKISTPEKFLREEHDYLKLPESTSGEGYVEIGVHFLYELLDEYKDYHNCKQKGSLTPEEFLENNEIDDIVAEIRDNGEWLHMTDVMRIYADEVIGKTKVNKARSKDLVVVDVVECCNIGPITKQDNYCTNCGRKIVHN